MKKYLILILCFGLLSACNNTLTEQVKTNNNTQEEDIMKYEYEYEEPKDLFTAIYNGDIKGVQQLIAKGKNVNIEAKCANENSGCSIKYKTPLLSAVDYEETEIVKLLLEAGANPNIKNYGEYTALDFAQEKGNKEIIKLLSDAGAKDTPLSAIIRGDVNAVKSFLDNGLDVNTKYEKEVIKNNTLYYEQDNLLSFAVKNNQAEIVKLLFSKGADFSLFHSVWDGNNSLFYDVIKTKNIEIIKEFMKKDKSIIDYICPAVETNDVEIVKLFIKNTEKNSLNYIISEGISCAAKKGDLDILKSLVSPKKDIFSNGENIHLEEGVESGNVELVKYLLNQGKNVSSKSLSKALDYAKDKDMVALLIKNGANVKDESILYHAIKRGNVEKVKLLLEAGANPNIEIEDGYGQTLLHYVAKERNAELAKILIEKGANVNAKDKYGKTTPLENALNEISSYLFYDDDIEIEKVLINNGADVNARGVYYAGREGPSPLERAAHISNKELIKLLLDKGAKVENSYTAAGVGNLELVKKFLSEATKEKVNSALYYAVKNGHKDIAEYLIKQGAEINDNLLFYAISSNNADIVKLLLQNGSNANANVYGESVIIPAIGHKNITMVKLLLDKGAQITDKTFEVVAAEGNSKIMKELFAKNSKVNLQNLLSIAAENGNKSVIDFLVSKGVKINTLRTAIALGDKQKVQKYLEQGKFFILTRRDDNGKKMQSFFEYKQSCNDIKPELGKTSIKRKSLLYFAVINNQPEIVKLLVQNGEKISDGTESIVCVVDEVISVDNDYSSTLELAVERNYTEIVKFLLENGIYVNSENAMGRTPLEYAKTEEMKQLLLKYGAKKGSGFVRMLE